MTIPYPTITAKIIADSIGIDMPSPMDASTVGVVTAPRLTTFECTYPRYIHAEIMTHRQLSRNAQSSRAIPVKRRLERVRENPVMPIRWGANQSGMQSKDEEVEHPHLCRDTWEGAALFAANRAEDLMKFGLHKQWANRVVEPFDTITVILTGTEWGNFFGLRCHKDAQPEFQNLAWKMADLYFNNEPKELQPGMWHMPYVTEEDAEALDRLYGEDIDSILGSMERDFGGMNQGLCKLSTARCARVSYLNHDRSAPDIDKDIALHNMLLESGHMSPFEHQAMVRRSPSDDMQNGNFARGWCQYRKMLKAPELRTFDYVKQVAAGDRPWQGVYTGEGA